MKAIAFTTALALGMVLLPSCNNMATLNRVSPNSVGVAAQVIPGTVIDARSVQIDATDSDKNLGTGLGAAIGAGAGSLLGRGKGQFVSTVGFGVVGAIAGRAAGRAAGTLAGQKLTIQADGSRKTYVITQAIYQEVGAIPVGTHGNLQGNKFLPDGY